MQFTREAVDTKQAILIQVAIAAAAVENPYRLYYGESDMPTPEFIRRALTEAVNAGHTTYTATPGVIELRNEVCRKMFETQGVVYKPTEVICTAGSGMAIFLALRATIGAGGNAIIISPAFSIFASTVTVFGGEVREVPLAREGNRFRLDLDQVRAAIDSRTKALVVNSPSNPTGWIITREEQQALWELALRHDLLIISDEVYERIVYDVEIAPSFARVATDRDHLLVLNSFSKTYNMTGWRLGYALGGERLIALMTKVAELVICSPPAMIQQAGIVALRDGEPFIRELREQYARRRRVTMEKLAGIRGLSLPEPQGAFYAFPQIDGLTDSMTFVKDLLRQTRVGVGPGIAFGRHGEGYIRISYASSESVLIPALDLFAEFMASR